MMQGIELTRSLIRYSDDVRYVQEGTITKINKLSKSVFTHARNRIDQVIDQVQQTVWSLKRRAMS